tara:strand:+ start:1970 stop:4015 length:2046 start_codon:yes stop_codon:yes gene_type:complete
LNHDKITERLLNEAYLNLGDTSLIQVNNPLLTNTDLENPALEILDLMRNPDYLGWSIKTLFNIDLLPFQTAVIRELWVRTFPMLVASRGAGKSFILSLYAMVRALLCPGAKIVIVGAAFRQSKLLFEYMETFWRNAPLLRSIVGSGKHQGPKRDVDRCTFYIGDSVIMAIPLGDGTKIRGLRANYIIADEFASIPTEVYETVVQGFASVSSTPVEGVKSAARIKALKSLGLWTPKDDEQESIESIGNQSILSGTAYYAFNHFADYWKRYKDIIGSQGDEKKLQEIFQGEVPKDFDWRKYSIIRIPYHKLPEGFMDATQVARAKATIHTSIYQMEYGACFCTDSDGFFKRSLVESCVTNEPLSLPSGDVHFKATTHGNPNAEYVFGVDPASERDNFSIVILEQHEDHRRIVYTWTTTRQQHKEKLGKKLVKDHDFYGYCARKIRSLMNSFPTNHIGIDSQGGGIAIMEALQDPDKIGEGEFRLWPYLKRGKNDPFWWEKENKPTDKEPGLHILHMVNFAKADWISEANHGMRKDFEDKVLLFPHFDSWSLGEAAVVDSASDRVYDTLEDCVMEIEELKDELATIEHSQTGTSGRDKWDTPQVKLPGNKKGRLRKDRYSSLLIANMVARTMAKTPSTKFYEPVGGFAVSDRGDGSADSGKLYKGPSHMTEKMTGIYGMGVQRR